MRDELREVRRWSDEFLERWAIAHQDHPIYEGAGGRNLWFYALALRRANLEMSCAEYVVDRKSFVAHTWKDGKWTETRIKVKE